jgi:hypothetical protein
VFREFFISSEKLNYHLPLEIFVWGLSIGTLPGYRPRQEVRELIDLVANCSPTCMRNVLDEVEAVSSFGATNKNTVMKCGGVLTTCADRKMLLLATF